MPTVLRVGPYRFFFFAGDRLEPPHVHVSRDDSEAKYWLDPIRFQSSSGFSRKELNAIRKMIVDHQTQLLDSWHDYFDN